MVNKRWFLVFALMGLLAACGVPTITQQSPHPVTGSSSAKETVNLTVSAAADLNAVFPEIGKLWEQATGNQVTFNFGSTGQLAQQIERGAPIDLFAAANKKFVEDLDQKGLIFSETKALYGVGRITLGKGRIARLRLKTSKI